MQTNNIKNICTDQIKFPILSPRLAKIAQMIPNCCTFADIGTDHGYLPVYLCNTGKTQHAIACDIKQAPLNRAKDTISAYNASEAVETRLGGGLLPLNIDEADAVVIAGMGGLLIADILNEGINRLGKVKTLILQPMSAIPELRLFLSSNNWTTISEALVVEGEKIYNIFSVLPPTDTNKISKNITTADICDTDFFIGKYLMENKPENFDVYIKKRYQKIEKMILGLQNSDSEESQQKLNTCLKLKKEISEIIQKG